MNIILDQEWKLPKIDSDDFSEEEFDLEKVRYKKNHISGLILGTRDRFGSKYSQGEIQGSQDKRLLSNVSLDKLSDIFNHKKSFNKLAIFYQVSN